MHALPGLAAIAILTLVSTTPSVAQTPSPDLVGERVRLTPEGGGETIVGTVTQQIPEALFIRENSGLTRPVPVETADRLERSLGRDSQELRGLLIGGGTGAVVSALVLAALAGCSECGDGTPIRGVATFVSVGAVVGLLVGRVASHEEWVDVPQGSGDVGLRIGWEPQVGQLGVGVSVAFD